MTGRSATGSKVLSMWTVYYRPLDYPQGFVARRFEIAADNPIPTKDSFTGDTLEEVRALLPPGLYNLGRELADEPQIVETWV